MNADHGNDGLYDLRDIAASDAWFTDAAARRLPASDPLSPAVHSLLERFDRELAALAPLDRGTVTALITGLAHEADGPRGIRRARHLRRNVVVVASAGALLVAAAGVAAASPGSFLYPVRQVALGAPDAVGPQDLPGIDGELDRIEVRMADAQAAGGITESARTALTRRLGTIHPIIEQVPGDSGDLLRARWTRDDLILITMPRLGGDSTPVTADPSTDATPVPSGSPTPSTASPSPTDGSTPLAAPTPAPSTDHPGTPAPQSHPTPAPRESHGTPAPTPKPSESHTGGSEQTGTQTPAPTPTPTTTTPTTPAAPTPTPSPTRTGDGEHHHTPSPTPTTTGKAPHDPTHPPANN